MSIVAAMASVDGGDKMLPRIFDDVRIQVSFISIGCLKT